MLTCGGVALQVAGGRGFSVPTIERIGTAGEVSRCCRSVQSFLLRSQPGLRAGGCGFGFVGPSFENSVDVEASAEHLGGENTVRVDGEVAGRALSSKRLPIRWPVSRYCGQVI